METAFLDHLIEGCQVISPAFRYLYVNPAVASQGKRTPAELVGRRMEECYPGIEQTPFFAILRRCMAERTPHAMENEFAFPDGSTGWFELRLQPVPEGLFILSLDITDRKSADTRLAQSQKLEAVGTLAGGVAHDFNNILTVILGTCDLATARVAPGDPAAEPFTRIREHAERAAGLTRQLLAFSRRQVLVPSLLDLSEVLRGMGDLLHRLLGEDIQLVLAPASSLEAVLADRGQIEQVVMNLAINARDAMPKGGLLTITTAETELDAAYAASRPGVLPGPHVMLEVTDTGEGMDAAVQARLFEPFFTTKPAGKGTGLGLSTVYGIVKQSGGNIWVYSEVGRGTTFKVYFPVAGGRPETARSAGGPAPARGTGTILLVEDEAALRGVVGSMLELGGYRVLTAADGREALDLVRASAEPLALIITDVIMPNMSGTEFAAEVGRLRPGIPVLFSSGYTDDAIARQGVLAPGIRFLQKPYTLNALLAKVRETLAP